MSFKIVFDDQHFQRIKEEKERKKEGRCDGLRRKKEQALYSISL